MQSKQGLLNVLEDQLRNKQAQEIKSREQKRVEFEGNIRAIHRYVLIILISRMKNFDKFSVIEIPL